MGAIRINLNPAILLCLALALPASAQENGAERLDSMYEALQTAEPEEARRIGREIRLELSKSGSPAMNLLLKRGRDAMSANDMGLAIEILSALTDHAPEFAEGWHARSVAFARAGMPGAAIGDLERALALDPRNFAAIYSLGALLEQIGQPVLALEAYGRVAEIHPHFDDTEANIARISADTRGADL
ncbi:tetratricopeptide repeat protein [Roseovarius aquimarinus]|uniref:Tetratricopeptide repeat protein n=1 Tax=Roseovarius aquimarinus TaxID=1229156 RepID=A0ABW7I4Y9_9RHOB